MVEDLKTLTAEETARLLGVSVETVRRYARAGSLAAFHWGARLRFRVEDIRAFQDSCRLESAASPRRVSAFVKRAGR